MHAIVILLVLTAAALAQENCTCVPYYQCSEETGQVITDGVDLMDPRLHPTTPPSPCTGYFDVCCELPPALSMEEPKAPQEELPEQSVSDEEKSSCGYQKAGMFPWTAALFYQECETCPKMYRCGASLIHHQAIVTAAHCLSNLNAIWTVQIDDIHRTIAKVVLHREFNLRTLHNDIALAVLEEPVPESPKHNVICIPPPQIQLNRERCVLSSLKPPNASTAPHLQVKKIPLIPEEKCVEDLRKTRLGVFYQLHKSFLCAGGDHVDACVGDGGSALVCPIRNQPGRFHQVGIVSWGIGCGELNFPGVYVNLPRFREWIDGVLADNALETDVYKY